MWVFPGGTMRSAAALLLAVALGALQVDGFHFRLQHDSHVFGSICFVELVGDAGGSMSVHYSSTGVGPLQFLATAPNGDVIEDTVHEGKDGSIHLLTPPGKGGWCHICVVAKPITHPRDDGFDWDFVTLVIDKSDQDRLFDAQSGVNPVVTALQQAIDARAATSPGRDPDHLTTAALERILQMVEAVLSLVHHIHLGALELAGNQGEVLAMDTAIASHVRLYSLATSAVCAAVYLLQYRHLREYVRAKKQV